MDPALAKTGLADKAGEHRNIERTANRAIFKRKAWFFSKNFPSQLVLVATLFSVENSGLILFLLVSGWFPVVFF